jgi:hypothetical protein
MKKLIIGISLMGFIATGFAQYPVVYRNNYDRYSNRDSRPGNALVIDTRGMRDFTVVVDNNMQYQSSGGAVTINSLRNGNHRIMIYENRRSIFGLFGRQRQTAILNSSVQLKPGVETSVFVDRNGQAETSEKSLYGYYNNNNYNNNNDTRWNDRRYNQPDIRNR